jgi:DNA-binding CsgD family transcriptional regulator
VNTEGKSDSSEHKPRKIRAKNDLLWLKLVEDSGGEHHVTFERLRSQFHKRLSKRLLKVCVLLRKDYITSWEIGNALGISEHTVGNYRSRIRKRLELSSSENLTEYLRKF